MAAVNANWQDEYRRLATDYERLRQEAEYALKKRIDAQGIKLHSLTSRVKSLGSLETKAQRKGYTSPLDQTPDVVGVRVVVLFLSDLSAVADIVESVFEVVDTADTIEGADDPSTFGYMSHHYEARIHPTHAGPRYEGLREIRFEVQVRTLLMDAWANVSHYLAYKGELSVPAELRRDFHALSGLFYVADKHFELFLDRASIVREETGQLLEGDEGEVALNLDTLAAFLQRRFTHRKHSPREGVGELADELLNFGYMTIGDLEDMLARSAQAFEKSEKELPPHGEKGRRFEDVGVVRVSLGLLSPDYEEFITQKRIKPDDT